MRPEKKQAQIELTEDEKYIIHLLKTNESKMELAALKVKSELSGKKWDAAMKSLSKHGMTKVAVADDLKFVELVG